MLNQVQCENGKNARLRGDGLLAILPFMKKLLGKISLLSSLVIFLAAACNQSTAANSPAQNPSPVAVSSGEQEIHVTEKVDSDFSDESFYYYPEENKSALDILQSKHKVDLKNFSGLGEMVVGINGQEADSKHVWQFFINGQISTASPASYKPVDGDSLEWKFSAVNGGGK